MDSRDLTPDLLHVIAERLVATLVYLSRLQARMERQGLTQATGLFKATCEAQAAIQALLGELRAELPGLDGAVRLVRSSLMNFGSQRVLPHFRPSPENYQCQTANR